MISRKVLQINVDHNFHRLLTTSAKCNGMRIDKIKSVFVKSEDMDKKPSDMEIAAKNLPSNTPTLRQRISRDTIHRFWTEDKKAGYHLGPTGTWRDFVDANWTVKDMAKIGINQIKEEGKKLVEDVKNHRKRQHKLLTMPGDKPQCGNFRIFLSLRFYVKSICENL